ncbi:hypothetical protein [Actinomycetospora atypica]|uniref:Ligand-binding SRPBCC domain-containing protein n=1 Tax=Actinomycetospora atypica TaxID=1290095 RepID=A0ABV9YUI4_9PSEU
MRRAWEVERASVVPAAAEDVWRRVATFAGIDDELRPFLTMSVPRGADDLTIDTAPVGEPLGRSWVRLFGVLPVEYDDLLLVEVERGRRFREESTMFAMRRWVHDRTVEPVPGGALVTDRVVLEPRALLVLAGPLLRVVVAALFAHRHRRLVRPRRRA